MPLDPSYDIFEHLPVQAMAMWQETLHAIDYGHTAAAQDVDLDLVRPIVEHGQGNNQFYPDPVCAMLTQRPCDNIDMKFASPYFHQLHVALT